MARYKPYNYSQRVMIPVSLEEQLVPGSLEFAIHEVVENRLDFSRFEKRFCNDQTGRPAFNPKILLKIVLLGYSRGLLSSRKIERACRENILFMAMTCDQAPDHSTIAEFIGSLQEEIVPLFRNVLLICEEMGLLGGTIFALDGCKLPGNASKNWSGTISELRHKKDKMEKKVQDLIREHAEEDRQEAGKGPKKSEQRDFQKRQIERLEKAAKRIEQGLEDLEPRLGTRGNELKSNLTDPESAKMKTSHGTIPGYNAQAVVDGKSQVIVAAMTSSNGQDCDHTEPMVTQTLEHLKAIGYRKKDLRNLIMLADSSYHTELNLRALKNVGVHAYIPDNLFRRRDPRFAEQAKYFEPAPKKFSLTDFFYDKKSDRYVCPNGGQLTSYGRRMRHGNRFFRHYVAKPRTCADCPKQGKCLTAAGAKRRILLIQLPGYELTLTEAMKCLIDTREGRKMYERRIGIVEPVFANLTTQKGLRRFTVRGKMKSGIQWYLYCLVHNLEKIGSCGKKR